MILRELHGEITKVIGKGKAIIVYGPRQVGKTTLLKSLLENHKFLLNNQLGTKLISILQLSFSKSLWS
jgi:predicted AAA+ superfamily ATPase